MSGREPYQVHTSGRCPHCRETVYFSYSNQIMERGGGTHTSLGVTSGGDTVLVYSSKCPSCKKPIVWMNVKSGEEEYQRLIHPFGTVRTVPPEVPMEIRKDFLEAATVLPTSEKASAALSRRCLQSLLSHIGHKKRDLSDQIDEALNDLPKRIAENLDAIRQIGNFAAHQMKQKSTGMIVDVEPEEANWNLDVLEELFEYYYVLPKRAEEKRKKLEAKLESIGKPPMKKPKETSP